MTKEDMYDELIEAGMTGCALDLITEAYGYTEEVLEELCESYGILTD